MVSFFSSYDAFLLEGIMPERALLRLKRAGIALYHVKKTQKNQILFHVRRKDSEKVFAIYPNVCYNITVYRPFTVKRVGSVGFGKYVDFCKNRLGLLLGAILFMVSVYFFDSWIFSIDFIGSKVYQREALAALCEAGITPCGTYRDGATDNALAKLLSLDGVEYCSVRKKGHHLLVEVRLSPFKTPTVDNRTMTAKHTGTVVSMTVLKGTALKKIGETVQCGEALVENKLFSEDGGQVCVEPIARVAIACIFDEEIKAETAEEAFAIAYLSLGLFPNDEIMERCIEGENGLFQVKIGYKVIETINLSN